LLVSQRSVHSLLRTLSAILGVLQKMFVLVLSAELLFCKE